MKSVSSLPDLKKISLNMNVVYKQSGLSLREMAEKTQVSPSTLHRMMHCDTTGYNPGPNTLNKVRAGLGLRKMDLF